MRPADTTADALRALLRRPGLPLRLAADMRDAIAALDRVEAGIAEMEAAEQGPRAATEPPWGWGDKREMM
ncbi:MAG: hypothetical protein KF889_25520 [Alphaproteobacteria bacterium]|nr:hypothetical protein [Alphaproteobacteria bacterium]MCW5739645.1 hypothetical protein [Alphaproteobacteria bacterium]